MDPYSAEGELVHIHSAYHQAQYAQVIDFDTSSFSSENELPAEILKLRAHIALGQYSEAIAAVKGKESKADFAAVRLLAEYLKSGKEDAVEKGEKLAEKEGNNLSVQLLVGTLLARAGKAEEALALLSKHQGSLDVVALIIQIHLQQNRLDLALKEAQQARKWAQDSLLVNIAESWVGLRQGGERYQAAFYVFEELAQGPASQSIPSLVGQAVSEIHLGRLPEAEAALNQALELDAKNPDILSNLIVLNTLLGKDTAAYKTELASAKSDHQLLQDISAKRDEFARASERYSAKLS